MTSISTRRLGVFLAAALLVVRVAGAQIVQAPTPPPLVTAADAAWQLRGDPVFYSGAFYDPSGATKFFDGNVMVRSGTFEGVPLYVDPTSTTFTSVLVPIGGNLMRPYERRPEGAGAPRVASPDAERQKKEDTADATGVVPPSPIPVASSRRPAATSIRRPSSNRGIWISYEGSRWHSAGAAVVYSADRFVPIGLYRGLPVYRDSQGPANEVYIPAVKDGPLAPFRKN